MCSTRDTDFPQTPQPKIDTWLKMRICFVIMIDLFSLLVNEDDHHVVWATVEKSINPSSNQILRSVINRGTLLYIVYVVFRP